jgi:hypothetical protein
MDRDHQEPRSLFVFGVPQIIHETPELERFQSVPSDTTPTERILAELTKTP